LITSPPLRVPRAHQISMAMVSLTGRTEPSAISTLTRPAWRLLAVQAPLNWRNRPVALRSMPYSQLHGFGGITWLYLPTGGGPLYQIEPEGNAYKWRGVAGLWGSRTEQAAW